MKNRFVLYLLAASFSALCGATETRYPSGLLESIFEAPPSSSDTRRSPDDSLQDFMQREFGILGEKFSWEKVDVVRDHTHVHTSFALKYLSRAVVDRSLKVNVLQSGAVESAVNNFSAPFILDLPPPHITAERETGLKNKLWKEWEARLGKIKGDIRTEAVIWVDPHTNVGYPAFDVRLILDEPRVLRRYIMHEVTGNVLEEKRKTRAASASVKVYKVSPYESASTDSVTLSDLNDTSSLRNSYFWVRRERTNGTTTETVEVEPSDYTDGNGCTTFKSNPTPTEYNSTCTGGNTSCCNMSFDAVNVYYHLSNFRSRINGYVTDLGATVNWAYDAPVNAVTGSTNTFSVLINPLSLDFGDPGSSDDANNALYVGEPCRSDGSMERCMVFLRPATLSAAASSASCNQSSSTLYDLAREALVVAHEYQHYVTDMITRIAFSSSSQPKVGDAIHEGYSDYMAASYVTDLAGANKTLVGEYALQQCTPLQREIGVLRVYDENDVQNTLDVHLPGQSWASAFWKLRTEYGKDIADRLAFKSLFFLSTTPGFIESIEAVVSADKALYAGAHVDRIRTLFYSEITFTGKNSLSSSGIGEIGFKGCGAVHHARAPQKTTVASVLSFFILLLLGGRWWVRGKGVR